jgi:uncharacterized membrane protein YhaH (DUF805 family)
MNAPYDPYSDRQDRHGHQEGHAPGGSYPPYPQGGGDPGLGGGEQRSYLQGGPVGFSQAISEAFRNIFAWTGRASRSAFWWFALFYILVSIAIGVITQASRPLGTTLDIIIGIPVFFASLALSIRRLHDAGHTGWWWLIGFVPVLGWIVLLVFYLQPGAPSRNRFDSLY